MDIKLEKLFLHQHHQPLYAKKLLTSAPKALGLTGKGGRGRMKLNHAQLQGRELEEAAGGSRIRKVYL